MRDLTRINKFCEQLAAMWGRVPDWRFGQLITNVFNQMHFTNNRDIFYIEDDEMLLEIKKFFNIEGDAESGSDNVLVIQNKLDALEKDIDVLEEEITGIKSKMSVAKTKGKKPMSKECKEWYDRAGLALHIKNNQLRKLHIEKMRTERALKAAKADKQKRRERVQNELFYAKLKELMSENDLKTFLEECQNKMDDL